MQMERIPVSLKVDVDSEFYTDFFEGLKANRTLSSFIMTLLEAYFQDKSIKKAINSVISKTESSTSLREQLDRIERNNNQNIMTSNMLSDVARNTRGSLTELLNSSVSPTLLLQQGGTGVEDTLNEQGVTNTFNPNNQTQPDALTELTQLIQQQVNASIQQFEANQQQSNLLINQKLDQVSILLSQITNAQPVPVISQPIQQQPIQQPIQPIPVMVQPTVQPVQPQYAPQPQPQPQLQPSPQEQLQVVEDVSISEEAIIELPTQPQMVAVGAPVLAPTAGVEADQASVKPEYQTKVSMMGMPTGGEPDFVIKPENEDSEAHQEKKKPASFGKAFKSLNKKKQ